MTTREEAFAYLLNAYESHGRYLDKRTKTADWISKPSQKARTWIRTTCTCLSLWLNLNAGPLAGKYYSWATIGQRGGYPASSARAISNLRKPMSERSFHCSRTGALFAPALPGRFERFSFLLLSYFSAFSIFFLFGNFLFLHCPFRSFVFCLGESWLKGD